MAWDKARFIATCKSVIRKIKSILAINALLICQRFSDFLYWHDKSLFLKSMHVLLLSAAYANFKSLKQVSTGTGNAVNSNVHV